MQREDLWLLFAVLDARSHAGCVSGGARHRSSIWSPQTLSQTLHRRIRTPGSIVLFASYRISEGGTTARFVVEESILHAYSRKRL